MCELASNGPLSHCTRNEMERDVSFQWFQYHLQWEFRMDTATSNSSWMQDVLEKFIGRLFDHPKSIIAIWFLFVELDMELQGINSEWKVQTCFEEQIALDLRRYWTAVVYDAQRRGLNTTTGASDLVRLKEETIYGINTWDVLFQFFLPQFDSLSRY